MCYELLYLPIPLQSMLTAQVFELLIVLFHSELFHIIRLFLFLYLHSVWLFIHLPIPVLLLLLVLEDGLLLLHLGILGLLFQVVILKIYFVGLKLDYFVLLFLVRDDLALIIFQA